LKNVGICTPFVANTPGLSTHSSELQGNFTKGTGADDGKFFESFTSVFSLPADTYTIIGHGRVYMKSATDLTLVYKFDVANALSPTFTVNLPPAENACSAGD
jgi:hypothetical protein